MNENKANYAKIGFFVLAGAALIVLVIGIAGARTFNKKVVAAETYFAESVTGLDLGSPVKYRGVPVGEVTRIGFVYSEYGGQTNDLPTHDSARQILVVMALDPERFGLLGGRAPDQVLRGMVRQGLRVKITSSGVTGLAFLELDYFASPGAEEHAMNPAWRPAHPFIPATPSTMSHIKKAVDDVFVKLSAIDLRSLGDELLKTLRLLQDTLAQADVASLSSGAAQVLNDLRAASQSVRKLAEAPELAELPADLAATAGGARRAVAGIETNLVPLVAGLRRAADRADALLGEVGGLVDTNKAVIGEAVGALGQTARTLNRAALAQQGALGELVRSLRAAAAGLERLVDDIGANPSSLLFGQPPPPLPEERPGKQGRGVNTIRNEEKR